MTPDVAAVFAAYPPSVRPKLETLRELILATAAETEGVGAISETLKWGQPSYLTTETKSGSTIRIGRAKGDDDAYALYVHCQTDLIDTFKERYPDTFRYEGKRAIIFGIESAIDEAALGHCIALALTYHLRKKRS